MIKRFLRAAIAVLLLAGFVPFEPRGADVRQWGVKFDGSTDNSAALQAAFTWAAKGNVLVLPAASACALFSTPITATVGNGVSATIIGGGQDASCLTYTGA